MLSREVSTLTNLKILDFSKLVKCLWYSKAFLLALSDIIWITSCPFGYWFLILFSRLVSRSLRWIEISKACLWISWRLNWSFPFGFWQGKHFSRFHFLSNMSAASADILLFTLFFASSSFPLSCSNCWVLRWEYWIRRLMSSSCLENKVHYIIHTRRDTLNSESDILHIWIMHCFRSASRLLSSAQIRHL